MAHEHSTPHQVHNEHHDGHILPIRVYWTVLIILLLLTIVTVAVAQVDFAQWGYGTLNIIVAMLIASVKAGIVALFFMHLKYDKLFHTVVFVSAILAAALFVGFTLLDSGQYQDSNIWHPDEPPAAPYGPRPTSG